MRYATIRVNTAPHINMCDASISGMCITVFLYCLIQRTNIYLFIYLFVCKKEVVSRYSSELGISENLISEVLENLRCHALEKLASKKQFKEKGLATLRVKLAGNIGKWVIASRK